MKETCSPSLTRNCKKFNSSIFSNYEQLSLPLANPLHCQKPQILSVPGISPKQRDRYRVVMGDRILGDQLTLDEALLLAKGGAK
jgi:hypothetical protein